MDEETKDSKKQCRIIRNSDWRPTTTLIWQQQYFVVIIMDSVVVDMLKYHTISLRFFNVFDDVDAEADDDDDEDNNNDQVTQARGSNFLAIRMRLR